MQFSRYIFDLYLQSAEGKESLGVWAQFLDWQNWNNLDTDNLLKSINSSLYLQRNEIYLKEILNTTKTEIINPLIEDLQIPTDGIKKRLAWEDLQKEINGRFGFTNDEELVEDAWKFWQDELEDIIQGDNKDREYISYIDVYSTYLTIFNPHFFFPYYFVSQFNLIENLFKEFDLILPEPPKVRDYKARLNYYFELCEVLYYFRQEYEMNAPEFLAFLYGFCGYCIKPKFDEDQKPLTVWLGLGSPDDYAYLIDNKPSYEIWQSNIEAQPGDIQLLYFWKISEIKVVTQIISNGFFDPFNYFPTSVNLKITNYLDEGISFKDLKNNSIWKDNSGVKMSMQIAGTPKIDHIEYQELKNILKLKNQDPDILPELESVAINTDLDLQNERDVEKELLEPLLEKMGFSQKDWVRQLSLRMGRGERIYPDYALFVDNKKKHEETAKFLWEAKYRIRNKKELRDAFLQAKSYARRLNSKAFGLCSVEGIWISTYNDAFEFEKLSHFNWKDLEKQQIWVFIK